jgi:hypothetical protein
VQGLLDDKIRAAERGGDVTELECPLVPEVAAVASQGHADSAAV